MRSYLVPLLWLLGGLFALISVPYLSSPRFLSRLDPEQLENLGQLHDSRAQPTLAAILAAYCVYGGVRALVGGRPGAWLWILAATTHAALIWTYRRRSARLGLTRDRSPASRRRFRRTLVPVVLGVICLVAGQPVAQAGDRRDSTALAVLAVGLLVVSLACFVTAGWTSVWVGKDDDPGPGADPDRT